MALELDDPTNPAFKDRQRSPDADSPTEQICHQADEFSYDFTNKSSMS